MGNSWTTCIHDVDEKAEALKQRMKEIAAGDHPHNVFAFYRAPASNEEMTAAEAIETVFRAHLVGHKRDNDWRMLWDLASKEPHEDGVQCLQEGSIRSVARKFGCHQSTVRYRRDMQRAAIWRAIEPRMPARAPSTGVVLPARQAA